MYRSGLPGFVNRKRIFIYLSNITAYLYAFKKYDFTHEDIPHGHRMAKFTAEIVPFYRCYILWEAHVLFEEDFIRIRDLHFV